MYRAKWFLVIVILFFEFSCLAQNSIIKDSAAFIVNGEPISKEEFSLFSNQLRADIIQYFRNNFKLDYSNKFWTTNCNGQTPKRILIKRVLDTLTSIKIQQILAKNNGLVNDISYSGFLQELLKENKSRIEAKNSKRPIYGPVQYSEMVYYDYRFSNLVIQLKKKLAESYFMVSEQKLDELCQNEKNIHKGKLSIEGYRSKVKAKYLDQLYDDYILKLVNKAKVEVNDDIINSLQFN